MNELKIVSFHGIETVDSRQVAKATGKPHNDLMKDIRRYSEYLGEGNFSLTDFFIESTYTTEQNKVMPCYLITRKGCEMVANKMTGQKGIIFTAMYVNAFHAMEQEIRDGKPRTKATSEEKKKRLQIQDMNARTRMAKMYLQLADVDTKSGTYKEILVAKAAEVLAGEQIIPFPSAEQKTYTATEIGEMFGLTPQKIGAIANQNGLKTSEFGAWFRDKSKYSNKEVDSFRYNENGIAQFRKILEVD